MNKIKFFPILLGLMSILSFSVSADRFYIEPANLEQGKPATLQFILDNTDSYYGFQADITLPTGVTPVMADGKYDISLSDRAKGGNYNVNGNQVSNGKLRVGAFSANHTPFSGDSGVLLYVNVDVANDFAGGDLKIEDIAFVNESNKDVAFSSETIALGVDNSALVAANNAAYKAVVAEIEKIIREYEDALTYISENIPGFNNKWPEIIEPIIDKSMKEADNALDIANNEGKEFDYVFDPSELHAMISKMVAEAKAYDAEMSELYNANQDAYNAVEKNLRKIYEAYLGELNRIKSQNPEFDTSEWEMKIPDIYNYALSQAEKTLIEANRNGEEFQFDVDQYMEKIDSMIAEMVDAAAKADDKAALEAANQQAYASVVASIKALQAKYEAALKEIKTSYPDFDTTEWEQIITNALNEASAGAAQALAVANEEGTEFSFPFDGTEIENMIAEMTATAKKDADQAALEAANKQAYDSVVASIEALQSKYEAALKEIKTSYPDFDTAEWEQIITNALNEASEGAAQALAVANEEGTEFAFPFDGTEIENMIAEMTATAKKSADQAALEAANKQSYDSVVASIEALQSKYEAALAEIKTSYPDFDTNEWENIITNAINEASEGAAQALAVANEEGTEFAFPFDGTEIENMIAEMIATAKKDADQAALEAANKQAYDSVVASIQALQTKYNAALAEIKSEYPDFDTTEWEQIITNAINEASEGAAQALAVANEEGTEFAFPFDGTEIENMITEMTTAANATTGLAVIEAEVAAGKARIFTLDGKQHSVLVRGEVNLIVRKNSTSRLFIKK